MKLPKKDIYLFPYLMEGVYRYGAVRSSELLISLPPIVVNRVNMISDEKPTVSWIGGDNRSIDIAMFSNIPKSIEDSAGSIPAKAFAASAKDLVSKFDKTSSVLLVFGNGKYLAHLSQAFDIWFSKSHQVYLHQPHYHEACIFYRLSVEPADEYSQHANLPLRHKFLPASESDVLVMN